MNPVERHEVDSERRVDGEYRRELAVRSSEAVRYAGPRNGLWTGSGLPDRPDRPDAVLVGRVQLNQPDDYVLNGRSAFYIGSAHAQLRNVEVFSWTAPIACAFFGGTQHHDICTSVEQVRTLIYRDGVVSDYVDDVAAHAHGSHVRRSARQRLTGPDAGAHRRETDPAESAFSDLRNESALQSSLTAPKMKALASHLATLQRDQYDLVTVPAMRTTVIEGPPGCGKTVIAVHRAAYVVSRDTPPENAMDGNVLLVGPTEGYVAHVTKAVSTVSDGADRIRIMDLPSLMHEVVGSSVQPSGSPTRDWRDAQWRLGVLAEAAVTRARTAYGSRVTVKNAYEQLRRGIVSPHLRDAAEWVHYLRQLPPFSRAVMMRAYLPLLAVLHWAIEPNPAYANIEHIIVDEAQDLTALEWFFIHKLNETRQYTLLGDLNQRRSDHTPPDWDSVLEILEVESEDETRISLDRGYRSTQPILDYAARLLPRHAWAVAALRADGPRPRVVATRSSLISRTLIGLIEQLGRSYADGTVAVIAYDVTGIHSHLLARGWAQVRNATWSDRTYRVEVHDADSSRGLEFDAVIVVEPADFRRNLARPGPLYTSLTRANKELVVVHAKPLPTRLEMS